MTWRRVGLVAIKAFHSAVFFALAGALVDFFWSAVRGRSDRRAALAGATVGVEAVIFAANGFRCPLTSIAEDLGAESGSVSDIYLPRLIDENLPYITGPVFAIGGLLHARNLWDRTEREAGGHEDERRDDEDPHGGGDTSGARHRAAALRALPRVARLRAPRRNRGVAHGDRWPESATDWT